MSRYLSAMLLLLCCHSAIAQRALLEGEFGLWLDQEATPKIVETFAKHPKFKGQRIQFASLANGTISTSSNELVEAIENHLTHAILKQGHNDVVWQAQQTCAAPTMQQGYTLSIQIKSLGRYKHRVDFSVLDTASFNWVSGLSLTWQGRLLGSEVAALKSNSKTRTLGSPGHPFKADQHAEIAAALIDQYRCVFPHSLAGNLHFDAPAELHLKLVSAALTKELHRTPGVVLAAEAEQAQWQIRLARKSSASGPALLSMSLRPMDGSGATQTLAQTYVLWSQPISPQPTNQPPATRRVASDVEYSPTDLIGELVFAKTTRKCDTDPNCLGVEFELAKSAYVLVFRTRNASVDVSCDSTLKKKSSGTLQYTVRNSESQPGRIGIYILASEDRGLMNRVHKQLRNAPGACRSNTGNHAWLQQTMQLVDQYQDRLSWRATHVSSTQLTGLKPS